MNDLVKIAQELAAKCPKPSERAGRLMANDLTPNTVADGKTVTDGYMTSLAALNSEYRATLDALDADYKAKRRALHNARNEERATLMADYWEKLAKKERST